MELRVATSAVVWAFWTFARMAELICSMLDDASSAAAACSVAASDNWQAVPDSWDAAPATASLSLHIDVTTSRNRPTMALIPTANRPRSSRALTGASTFRLPVARDSTAARIRARGLVMERAMTIPKKSPSVTAATISAGRTRESRAYCRPFASTVCKACWRSNSTRSVTASEAPKKEA